MASTETGESSRLVVDALRPSLVATTCCSRHACNWATTLASTATTGAGMSGRLMSSAASCGQSRTPTLLTTCWSCLSMFAHALPKLESEDRVTHAFRRGVKLLTRTPTLLTRTPTLLE
eukprot:3546326-Prymnesium_polylepis.1